MTDDNRSKRDLDPGLATPPKGTRASDTEKNDGPEGIPKTAIIVGAGARGHTYSSYAKHCPDQMKIVGVCDPREYHKTYEQKLHNIPSEHLFSDWKDAAALDKLADCVIICTPDRLHKGPAITFAKKGYSILLEKPMAVTEEDCMEIVRVCQENNITMSVCHVLRYTAWVQKVKVIIDNGDLGEIVHISHTEPVGYWYYAHDWVRGDWSQESKSSPSLMVKCCHDVDLLCHWMSGKRCEKVSSFGSLNHFKKEQKPVGATSRCLDCPADIENNCPYSAKKIYLEPVEQGRGQEWPISKITDVVDIENVTKALQDGPYGRCVYHCGNDVVSHQVVNMQFESGVTATLNMVAFTKKVSERQTKIYGTKGEMTVKAGSQPKIKVYDFLTKKTSKYFPEDVATTGGKLSPHGSADFNTIKAFVDTLHNPSNVKIQTGPEDTLRSHMVVFAAERSRKENRVGSLKEDGRYD